MFPVIGIPGRCKLCGVRTIMLALAARDLLSIFEVITPARLVIASLAAAVEPIGESTTAPVRA